MLADFMGDQVVYRNLEPLDPRLQGLRLIWRRVGLDHYYVPRKTATEYADALADIVSQAQSLRGASSPVRQLLFIGDTAMNDGAAARNIGRYWPMTGFIGAERAQQAPHIDLDGDLMLANRWVALGDFWDWARARGVSCDESTALLIDLDKTSLGARGRNDKAIDAARVAAMRRTMEGALGDELDEAAFLAVYDPLNQPERHAFTADNQDYLAYICLMVLGGIYPAGAFWADLKSGVLASFQQFEARCDTQRALMAPGLAQAHAEVRAGLAAEDPTPFKVFRRGEYLETVARMDFLPDDASEAEVLAHEIVITAEVASLASWMARQGVLVFGISDKPDEASLPTAELAAQGCLPLHHTRMKAFGQVLV